eukprot:5482743-Prymnesium_polylepis.1
MSVEECETCLASLVMHDGGANVQVAGRSYVCDVLHNLSGSTHFGELNNGTVSLVAKHSDAADSAIAGSLKYKLALLTTSQRREYVAATVIRTLCELTDKKPAVLSAETPLMEAGIDSLAATEFSSRLRLLTGVALSPTLVFEQPTVRAVAAHVLEQAGSAGELDAPMVQQIAIRSVDMPCGNATFPMHWGRWVSQGVVAWLTVDTRIGFLAVERRLMQRLRMSTVEHRF